jgi:putative spermidine/putrescine transport system permease protein
VSSAAPARSSERAARRGGARWALRAYCAVVFLFLMAPLVIVFPISLSSAEYLQFPPPGLSLKWFERYFTSIAWIDATIQSLKIGAAVSLVSLLIGVPLAFALVRGRLAALRLAEKLVLAPVIVPNMVIAVSIYGLFAALKLVGSWPAVAIAHTLLALPFVTLVVTAGLRATDPALERAAAGLGAGPLTTFWRVTLPQIRPSLVTGGLFAFVISFDELVIALFLSGAAATLPKKMFENITFAIDPTIAAVSVLKILAILVILVASGALARSARVQAVAA